MTIRARSLGQCALMVALIATPLVVSTVYADAPVATLPPFAPQSEAEEDEPLSVSNGAKWVRMPGCPVVRHDVDRGLVIDNQAWGESFFRFGFLNGSWYPSAGAQSVSIFNKQSVCRSLATWQDGERVGAEMTIDTFGDLGGEPRTSIRMVRQAGDPWLYLRIAVQAKEGDLGSIALNGLPFVYEWGDRRPYLDLRRSMWVAGHDHVLEKNGESLRVATAATPEQAGGIFWYNRGSYRTGGNLTVYLPEESDGVNIRWSWPVTVAFRPPEERPTQRVLRLAIYRWRDGRGWQSALAQFQRDLPDQVDRLRRVSFASPAGEQFPQWEHALVERLIAAEFMLEKPVRDGLAKGLRSYDEAVAALATLAVDSDARYAAESTVFVMREELRKQTAMALDTAMSKGWPLAAGIDVMMLQDLEGILND